MTSARLCCVSSSPRLACDAASKRSFCLIISLSCLPAHCPGLWGHRGTEDTFFASGTFSEVRVGWELQAEGQWLVRAGDWTGCEPGWTRMCQDMGSSRTLVGGFLLWITVSECLLSFYYVAGPVLSPGGYCSDVDTDSVLMEFTAQ